MKNLIITFFLILISCKNSNHEAKLNSNYPNISDEDIYEIVNLVIYEKDWALKNIDGLKTNPFKYIIDKNTDPIFNSIDSIAIVKEDTIFSRADLKFIEKQINDRKKFKFDCKFIISKKIISSKTLDSINLKRFEQKKSFYELFKKKFGDNEFYSISLPIFSIDKKTVFVTVSGMGSGMTRIYKKVNNKWKYCCSSSSWQA